MSLAVTPTQDDVFTTLTTFLVGVLPAGVQVIQLDENRTAMPPADPGFVGMLIRMQKRVMTNIDSWDISGPPPTDMSIMQAVAITVQLDCYGANAYDWAVILSTVLRDEYSVPLLAPILSPLYTDEPRFAPLANGEEQYERRWIVDAHMQYNPVVTVTQQYFDTAETGLIDVDVEYPP